MREIVKPEVYLVASPRIDWVEVQRYLDNRGAGEWYHRHLDNYHHFGTHAASLIEFMGRICYRSWLPGLNANVTKVRDDSAAYLRNLIDSDHGSVLEHAMFSFVFSDVSRVFTHELVRHRVGTAISQESGRYVAQQEMAMWMPDWTQDESDEIVSLLHSATGVYERIQAHLRAYFHLDDPDVPFARKKAVTSFIRRMLPEGRANEIGWSANVRTLRQVIQRRTAPDAEEEIRIVFGRVAEILTEREPLLFGDLGPTMIDGHAHWRPAS